MNKMKDYFTPYKSMWSLGLMLMLLGTLVSCSVTSHLPENDLLYAGVERIDRLPSDTVDALVDEAMALALEVPPTNAFFGSAYHMSPLPLGLWAYNAFYPKRETGLRHWLWSKLKSDPKLLSQVNPQLRAQAAEAILKDEGYFDSEVTFDTIYDRKDSLRVRLLYNVRYNHSSKFGQLAMLKSPSQRADSIIARTKGQSLLHPGERFSASKLEEEKNRLTAVFHDSGYFFFSPDYIRFLGDSTLARNTVALRMLPDIKGDMKALRPCVIDSVFYHLDFGYGMHLQNFENQGFMTIGYNGQQTVKTKYLQRALGFGKGALYQPQLTEQLKANLNRLNAFQYTSTEFQILNPELDETMPDLALDTLRLLLKVHAVNNTPWTGGTEVGVVYKDNQQVGPGVTLTAQRRNLFGGGEVFSGELTGSYEWSTGVGSTQSLNSFELGTKLTYAIPRLPLQRYLHVNRNNPVTSRYSVSVDWMRRGGLFEMIKSSASMDYSFSRGDCHTFTLTPLRLTYVRTMNNTARFDSIVSGNEALSRSLENQFIPQFQFSWIYNNAGHRSGKVSHQYLRVSLAEAGALMDLFTGSFGTHRRKGERQLWGQRFSQFIKATVEFSNIYVTGPKSSLVSHFIAGAGYAYGNSLTMPYSEQYYIGGPNSLRGFSVRSIGPGTSRMYAGALGHGSNNRLYSVGDYKLEANIEYRFPLTGSLFGALFADAGNIWKFGNEYTHPEETMQGNLLGDLALDCGAGLRIDLGMLVVRFDVGVPLHDPNSEGSYFNCRSGFFKHLGYNLAVGYPF